MYKILLIFALLVVVLSQKDVERVPSNIFFAELAYFYFFPSHYQSRREETRNHCRS